MRTPGAGRVLLALVVVCGMAACGGPQDAAVEVVGETMGTTYSIRLPALPADTSAPDLKRRVDSLLERINDHMSTYLPGSELSRFNASASTQWFALSGGTYRVLDEARRVSRLSGGAFDVTVGPAVNLWGFGPGRPEPRVPSDAEIAAVGKRIGHSLLMLRAEPPAMRKARADVYVDLSAIAKGYAVDEIAALLDAMGVADYLVEIGGELRARGLSQRGDRWRVAIERPVAGQRSVHRVLRISDTGMATSGNYRNFFEADGRRYAHTIDPRTARPVGHALASVTVLHPSTMTADALATAMTVLGAEDGLALAGRLDVAALFLVADAGALRERPSPAFSRLMGES